MAKTKLKSLDQTPPLSRRILKARTIEADVLEAKPSLMRRLDVALVLLLTMAGTAALSIGVLMHQSLRLDEAQSLWQTSHSFGDTLRVVAQDVHVPLYHVILHFWQLYFGHGVVTVRLLSLAFLLATIPLVYILARQVLTTGWALFAAVVFAFTPFVSWYGSEARMYTLLAFFATLSQIYFIRILQGKKAWKGYGITAIIGAYSHYFFFVQLSYPRHLLSGEP